MKRTITLILAALVTTLPAYAVAQDNQDRWQWEVRTEFADPRNSGRNPDVDSGVGFQGTVSYRIGAGFGVYTGLDINAFDSDSSFAGDDVTFVQSGLTLGMQWQQNFPGSNLGLRVRAGAIYGEISIHDNDRYWYRDDEIANSSHGLGWEVGVALRIAVGNNWVLTPGVRYRELSRNVTVNGSTRGIDLDSVNFGIGFGTTF